MEAALAGSTKIPSLLASQRLRLENFFVGHDVDRAARFVDRSVAPDFQLAGFPMRMADATVSGFSMTCPWNDWRRAGRLESDHPRKPRGLSGVAGSRDNPPNRP